jgi:hypothetical protein
MNLLSLEILRLPAALLAGTAIGLAFGAFQKRARQRNEQRQREGQFNSGWAATPGSFRRVAYLLVALALVQLVCPILFVPGSFSSWAVSAGVVLGYGVGLYRQMRLNLA